jgi:UDP-GlcNAc:undecaprenyl-phosphate/decaprenyl-phosphate GlcNAc-1-phosphate transferase
MVEMNKGVTEDPTPHPARNAALVRDWIHRYTLTRRFVLAASLICLSLLFIDPLQVALHSCSGRWLRILLISWLVSLSLTPLAEFLAFKTGAVDWPDRRRIHNRPTPRLGGVAVFGGIVAALLANGIWDPQIALLMICAGLLFALGAAEDIAGISAPVRLLTQVILSIVLVRGGMVLTLFPQDTIFGFGANAVITVLWIVGITNAFNFFDGMDGLAAGLAILMGAFLGAIAFSSNQPHLGWVSVAVLGGALGFLPYNFSPGKPAEIFLGDGGSTVLGFIMAGLAVHGEWAVGHPLLNLSPPLLIFGVLIYDTIHTTVCRIARGDVRTFREWVEYTGRDHLHHRFEALLRSKRYSVFMVLLLVFCLSLAALIIRQVTLPLALVLLLQCLVILILVTILEMAGNHHERRNIVSGSRKKLGRSRKEEESDAQLATSSPRSFSD